MPISRDEPVADVLELFDAGHPIQLAYRSPQGIAAAGHARQDAVDCSGRAADCAQAAVFTFHQESRAATIIRRQACDLSDFHRALARLERHSSIRAALPGPVHPPLAKAAISVKKQMY